jgi:CheY-like chemotaxis protein
VTAAPASILVVDDDPVNRMVLARELARQDHRVVTVEDGRRALEALGRQLFDVVLLDVLMPDMDGYQTLTQIEADEKLRHIPVIMVSALEDMESVVRCIEMGAADYVPKPFDPVLLFARINGCLTKKRLHDREREYIEQVGHVVAAATTVENRTFDAATLDHVAQRDDALGQLARVFRRLAREHAVARSLAETADPRDALARALAAIGESLGWRWGAVWEPAPEPPEVLRCVETWSAVGEAARDFEVASRSVAMAVGDALPGRVWRSGEPAWIGDVLADENFPRAAAARRGGSMPRCWPPCPRSAI